MVNKTPRWVSYVDAITLYMDRVNFELQSMGHDIMHKEREVQDEGIHTQQPCPSCKSTTELVTRLKLCVIMEAICTWLFQSLNVWEGPDLDDTCVVQTFINGGRPH
jgi:hypothetical protein